MIDVSGCSGERMMSAWAKSKHRVFDHFISSGEHSLAELVAANVKPLAPCGIRIGGCGLAVTHLHIFACGTMGPFHSRHRALSCNSM